MTRSGRKLTMGFDEDCCSMKLNCVISVKYASGLRPTKTSSSNILVDNRYEEGKRPTSSFYRHRTDGVHISRKFPKQYSLPDFTHPVKVVFQIVQGGEGGKQDLAGLEEVAEISPGVGPASVTIALGIRRLGVVAIAGLLDQDAAGAREEATVSGVARGQ